MGREAGGIVGAIAGGVYAYYTGDYRGIYYGYVIGSGLGAMTETTNVEGPRLSDLRFTSSQYGQPIPWIRGSPRVSGQIVWASDKREVSNTTSQGKGGGAESTSFTYEMDVLVLLCDHEAAAVSRIWSNGKLVWTRRTGASNSALAASDGSDLWRRLQLYSGTPSQLPDPTYEADVGIGNAPAYRGRTTLMIEGLQLGGSGQLPNLTFEVLSTLAASGGEQSTGPTAAAPGYNYVGAAAAAGSTVFRVHIGQAAPGNNVSSVKVWDLDLIAGTTTQVSTYAISTSTYSTATGNSDEAIYLAAQGTNIRMYTGIAGALVSFTMSAAHGGADGRFCKLGNTLLYSGRFQSNKRIDKFNASGGGLPIISSSVLPDYVQSLIIIGNSVYASALSLKEVYVLDLATLTHNSTIPRFVHSVGNPDNYTTLFDLQGDLAVASATARTVRAYRNGVWVLIASTNANTLADANTNPSIGVVGNLLVMGKADQATPSLYRTNIIPLTVGPNLPTVRSVVEDLCARAGMPSGTYDASALAAGGKVVRSLAVNIGATRGVLEQMGTAYFFQANLRDKLYFRPRGSSAVVTIPFGDLAAGFDGPSGDENLPLTLGDLLELPPQAAVTYINTLDDSQAGTEMSDRMIGGQAATRTLQIAIGMTPSDAKGIADAIIADSAAGLVSGTIALPIKYAYLDPANVVVVQGRSGSEHRLRLHKKSDQNGVLTFDVVGDDATSLDSARITDATQSPASEVTKAGDTLFAPLDIPLLRDVDDAPGYYVAAKGSTSVWPGGVVVSSENGVDFTPVAEVNESAVFGNCSSVLGAPDGVGFDEENELQVNVGYGELASTTRDALLADQTVNALLVGNEIVRFRTAMMTAPGAYTLTGLLRGQLGTEWAMGSHVATERCVLLRARGLRRVSQQLSESGKVRYLRAGTIGSTIRPETTEFTNTNRGLKPLAPVRIVGAVNTGQAIELSWLRRSRLSSRFLAPAGVPLGEAQQAYVVRIYTLGPPVLRRTINVTGQASVVYTRAQQIADGVLLGVPARVDVAQVSSTVGEGYVGSGVIVGAAESQPQIVQITLGGSFQAGTTIRALLGGTAIDYTTTGGDATLAGVATSLAAAIASGGTYSASAAGQVVTVTGPNGGSWTAAVSILSGDNLMSLAIMQAAAAASPGTQYIGDVFVTNSATGATEPVPTGTFFSVTIERPINTQIGSFSFTTTGPSSAAAVHSGLARAFDEMFPPLRYDGYAYGTKIVSGVFAGVVAGPVGVPGIYTQTSASSPFGLGVSVQQPGSAPVPSSLPQISKITPTGTVTGGRVYRVTLAGVDFDYTAQPGDTLTQVAAGLAAAINPDPAYIATSSGAVVTIEAATPNVPFTFAARVISSTLTVASAITQQAS